MDKEAHATIEKLHKDTHGFIVAIVQKVDALNERIDGVSKWINATTIAVEQQMEFLMASE